MRRGHRVSVLAVEAADRAFWLAQGLPVQTLAGARQQADDETLPLRELADIDCRLAGHHQPRPAQRRRATRRLAYSARALLHLLAHDPPDAILLHEGRSGLHRLVHFLARRQGIAVLHLGEGLLPATLVVDHEGVDGDASLTRRIAADYRGITADPAFLQAALAGWLGGSAAPSALRRPPSKPLLFDRLLAAASAARHGWRASRAAVTAWQAAQLGASRGLRSSLPMASPAIVVLLQPTSCPRMRLDAPPALSPQRLLHATRIAVDDIDRTIAVVGVLPREPLHAAAQQLFEAGCQLVPQAAAAAVLATALAVVTVNHPLAGAALLHGTPVVHLGRAIYGVRGVAVGATLATLRDGLTTALSMERPSLRERFLTRVLRRDHVWCAAESPDRNGLHGLMQTIERLLQARAPHGGRIVYRPGPVWPLTTVG